MSDAMLSTSDNPFSPFTQWDEWYAFDLRQGYDTCGYLARVTHSSPALSPADQDAAIDHAIDEILEYNILGIYKKVFKEDFPEIPEPSE
jgi:hypothetical protein